MTKKERSRIARESLLAAKARGVKIGRPIHQEREKMIKLIKKGRTYRAIAEEMGCGVSTIWRALKEEGAR